MANKREAFKDIEINGRKWRIGSFDALTGSYIVTLLLMQVLPMGLEAQLGIPMPKNRSLMDKNTFIDLQKDCLKVVSEVTQVGATVAPIPVLLPNGAWGVSGIETDVSTVLALTIHTLLFNISDFFQGNTLNDLAQSFQGLSLFSVKE